MQVTLTLEKPTNTVLKLKDARPSEADRVDAIVKQLQDMEIFALEEKTQISVWKKELLSLFTHGDKIPEKLEVLIQLAADIVEPKFLVDSPESVQLELLKIDAKIKDLMKGYLPLGKTSEAAIESYLLKSRKINVEKISNTPSSGKKLAAILSQMLQSPYFSSEEKALVTVWVNTLPPQFFDTLNGESTSQLASIGLCYLLCKLLHPALLRAKDEKEKSALMALIRDLKELLRLCMPEGENLEELIKNYQNLDRKAELFAQKQLIVRECSIQARNQLCAEANTTKDKIVVHSEKNKQQLLEFSASRREIGNRANEKALAPTGKIEPLILKMKEEEHHLIAMADSLEACHHQFRENTRNCQKMLEKL